jgi:anhydro-N-acetylmuramic acid kinase
MLRLLGRALNAEVVTAEAVGWSSPYLEAQAFAYLAARSLKGLPITFPSTTGVKEAMTGGEAARP